MNQHPGSFSGGGKLDLSIKQLGRVFHLLTSRQLSCSATVSSGSAIGSMMQQFERELQYNMAVSVAVTWEAVQKALVQWMEGSKQSINNTETNSKILQYMVWMYC